MNIRTIILLAAVAVTAIFTSVHEVKSSPVPDNHLSGTPGFVRGTPPPAFGVFTRDWRFTPAWTRGVIRGRCNDFLYSAFSPIIEDTVTVGYLQHIVSQYMVLNLVIIRMWWFTASVWFTMQQCEELLLSREYLSHGRDKRN